jgi:hypothetical protein
MRDTSQSLGRTLVAQVAVWLLVLQSTFGILVCPNRFVSADPLEGGFLCSAHQPAGMVDASSNPAQAPAHDPKSDCPACLTFCHAAAVLAAEIPVPAPATNAAFEQVNVPPIFGETLPTPHNRGPPLSFPA